MSKNSSLKKPLKPQQEQPLVSIADKQRSLNPSPRMRSSFDSTSSAGQQIVLNQPSPEKLQPEELKNLHILRRVSIESIWGLFEQCRVLTLEEGTVLLNRGQSNQIMYMILSGKLRVHLDRMDGNPLTYLDAGQTVGEISVIDDSPATAYVIAACETRLLAVDEETFWRTVLVSHEFATNLLLLLAQRMRNSNTTILEDKKVRRQLEIDSTVDALTGLFNRRWLDKNLPRLVSRYQRSAEPLSVILLDIDHFKRFNDDFGHAAGDRVLSAVGRVLKSKLRPTDLAVRYGGEEFVVVLPGTPLSGAEVAAERLRIAMIETKVKTSDCRNLPPVTLSLGVSELIQNESSFDLLARADTALYSAKDRGRNRVECSSC